MDRKPLQELSEYAFIHNIWQVDALHTVNKGSRKSPYDSEGLLAFTAAFCGLDRKSRAMALKEVQNGTVD